MNSPGTKDYKTKDKICLQGDPSENLFVIRSGSVKLVQSRANGQEQIVAILGCGDFFGGDFSAGVYQYSAHAITPVGVYEYDQMSFGELTSDPELAARFLLRGIEQSHNLCRHIALLGSMTVEQRVAAFLLSNAGASSGMEFRLLLSRQEIANYLSMRVETISRALATFKELGLVRVRERRLITITNTPGLRAFIDSE